MSGRSTSAEAVLDDGGSARRSAELRPRTLVDDAVTAPHAALDRVVGAARQDKANAVVGIRTTIQRWAGTHEMIMSGTAAFNPALPGSAFANPVTSDQATASVPAGRPCG